MPSSAIQATNSAIHVKMLENYSCVANDDKNSDVSKARHHGSYQFFTLGQWKRQNLEEELLNMELHLQFDTLIS